MKRPYGISLEIGIDDRGIPHFNILKQRMQTIRPHIKDNYNNWIIAPRGGFKFDIGLGCMRRPIPKFWKKEFWLNPNKHYVEKEQATNPWNSGNAWFVLTIPFMPYFFMSLCYGSGRRQPGFYLGFKTYKISNSVPCVECQLKEYKENRNDKFIYNEDKTPYLTWCNEKDIGKIYLCLSASLRDDLID